MHHKAPTRAMELSTFPFQGKCAGETIAANSCRDPLRLCLAKTQDCFRISKLP